MSKLLWPLAAVMILVGVFLPERGGDGLFGSATAAVKTVLTVGGAGLILYDLFGNRRKPPAASSSRQATKEDRMDSSAS